MCPRCGKPLENEKCAHCGHPEPDRRSAAERGFTLDGKAVEAIAVQVAKQLKPKEPPPWDTKAERRATERRKAKEPDKPKYGKVGGLISYKE